MPNTFLVTEAESGQKLLQILLRRLHLPKSLLHRWIRTGQVRCNALRCTPYQRVETGDSVRLPPFALAIAQEEQKEAQKDPVPLFDLPEEIGRYGDLIAYHKPAGLCTHPGSGHTDSLATRLAAHFAGKPFIPVPCHRLDRDTSGVLLVATSYASLRAVSDALTAQTLTKDYLCWVRGLWTHKEPLLLRDFLVKDTDGVRVSDRGRVAETLVFPILCGEKRSLLRLQIRTGRTHQIRVQLAHRGFPILGDRRYGSAGAGPLFLHAFRLTLPDGHVFQSLPAWPHPYTVSFAMLSTSHSQDK
ncbi:MAG: RluA family pseudouridine synthase [Desulfovibrionaceae bacterium]|nr:RluA family pseudouridine synthase [Desulfovibrionaceae bacterium]